MEVNLKLLKKNCLKINKPGIEPPTHPEKSRRQSLCLKNPGRFSRAPVPYLPHL
jgi:hypothetical protein